MRKKINLHWWESNFPCFQACPVHTEAGRYISLIAQGKYSEAYRVARRTNPLASICGRICAAPCEAVCTRGAIDSPISIRALKRFVCERYGVESMLDLTTVQALLRERLRSTGKWVAVVGGGPAGLAAAHDLALLGHKVSLFEAQPVLGGMLTLGIPEYRLPRELIRLEINAILNLGIEVHLGKKLGRDFSLADLQENGYGAVFLALGAHRSRELRIEGIHADGVIQALDFLLNVNRGYRVQTGERILVIGGGSVAFDVARTAARQPGDEEPQVSDMVSALDVARSAIRFGAKHVEIICLESASEMPADPGEIEDAREEGIRIHHSRGPKRILTRDGKVTGLEVLSVASVFDEQGRFNPKMIPRSEQIIETDSIIIAIGQEPDFSFISPADGLDIQTKRTIRVNPNTLASSKPGIWAGGDVAFGPRNVIHAVADGKCAALSIHRFLMKLPEEPDHRDDFIYVPDVFAYHPLKDFDSIPAQKPPKLPLDRRTGIAQVELDFSEESAVREGSRCLHCWFNTIFSGREEEASECVLCGACADICPEWCIDILPRRMFSGELSLIDLGRSPEQENGATGPSPGDSQALIIKDESRCIRCGLCAKRCPVNCITMQGIFFGEAR